MARRLFTSKVVAGRDGDVCGLTGNMSTSNARMKELANKRGIGILMGGTPITVTTTMEKNLKDPSKTESQLRVELGVNAKVLYYDHDIKFNDLANSYCGINSNTQIIFVYDE